MPFPIPDQPSHDTRANQSGQRHGSVVGAARVLHRYRAVAEPDVGLRVSERERTAGTVVTEGVRATETAAVVVAS
jgi:hypothetical protein